MATYNENTTISIQENEFENTVCKLAAMLSQPQYVYGLQCPR